MAIRGCLLKKAADQTAANYSTGSNITWDTEAYDTDGFHDTGSNTERITIPSAVNGQYGIFTVCLSTELVTVGTSMDLTTYQPASVVAGNWSGRTLATVGNGQATTSNWIQVTTGPVLLATGAIYVSNFACNDTSITLKSHSTYGLLVLDSFSETMRCLAKMNADQTANYSTPTAIAFDGTDEYDTHSIHSPSSNNPKLIIPAALNNKYVVVTAQIRATSVAAGAAQSLAIRKGGSLTYTGMGGNSGSVPSTYNESRIQAQTNVIQVVTGDEFDALYYTDDTNVTLEAEQTCLGLRVVG